MPLLLLGITHRHSPLSHTCTQPHSLSGTTCLHALRHMNAPSPSQLSHRGPGRWTVWEGGGEGGGEDIPFIWKRKKQHFILSAKVILAWNAGEIPRLLYLIVVTVMTERQKGSIHLVIRKQRGGALFSQTVCLLNSVCPWIVSLNQIEFLRVSGTLSVCQPWPLTFLSRWKSKKGKPRSR